VPGFMAGVQAAPDRFGKKPFNALFQPPVFYAEKGVEISPYLPEFVQARRDVLSRRPDKRRIFTQKDGSWLTAVGGRAQPGLGRTLRCVAEQGAKYMYEGEWAGRFVQAVQSEGGRITREDLAGYKAIWREPVVGRFRDFELRAHGVASYGGVNTIEAMKLYEL